MWSGPRTISTALMRSFGNRPDTVVADEPLYAFYLAQTGLPHPGRDEVLASMPGDWRAVLRNLATAPPPAGKSVCYAKHMTHHLLPEVDAEALAPFRHAYLIRDPAQLLASYARVRSQPDLDDLGIRQQAEIFARFPGPVLDSGDLLADPEGMLRALCAALGIPFTAAMLSWPPGPRPTDGVWGRYWYASVWQSTGFGRPRTGTDPPPELAGLAGRCRPYYERMRAHRLAPAPAGPAAPTGPAPARPAPAGRWPERPVTEGTD
jgi:sulfotransferase family protein